MKKIGNTTTGSVIVEMTSDEYDAIQHLQGMSKAPVDAPAPADSSPKLMTQSERVTYVAERLKKLQPKKKDGVIRSIDAMFQFTGGIAAPDVERVIKALAKQGFFSIDANGRVAYH